MESRPLSANRLVSFVFGVVFAVGLAGQAFAQGSVPPPGQGQPANNNPSFEDRARHAGEEGLRRTELNSAVDSENEERVHAAVKNVKEDFTRIQVLRNDIARNLVARKPVDYNLVSQQTAEINKCAKELKIYMMARVAEDKKENEGATLKNEELVGALVNLCKLIDSFTENPALKNAATVNVKEVEKAKADKAKADKDLLAIIGLSESIQKTSGALKAAK